MERGGYPICGACGGNGNVLAATGGVRPCSRCRADDFSRWYADERDAQDAAKALADFEKNGGTTLEELKRELGV